MEMGARAAELGWRVTILPVANADEGAARLAGEALQTIPAATLHPDRAQSVEEIVRIVQASRGELLICPWNSSLMDEPSFENLVNQLDCLVMLVR